MDGLEVDAGHRVFGDEPLQLSVANQAALNIVIPDALAQILQFN